MKRRDVLRLGGQAAFAAATGVSVSAIGMGAAQAGQAPGHGCFRSGLGETRCQVGFASAPYIEPQPCRSLCWLNCVAYVLRGYGAKISLESVALRMEMPGGCTSRDDKSILMRTSGFWRDDTGRAFLVKATRYPDIAHGSHFDETFKPMVQALSRKPLIVGVPGHSMILTQMSYIDGPMVLLRQQTLTVRDPWNGTPNLRSIDYDDSPERMFAIGLDVRRV